MSSPDFQHLRLSMVKDVAVVEIHDEAAALRTFAGLQSQQVGRSSPTPSDPAGPQRKSGSS